MWRSHLDKFSYSEEENQHLGDAIERGRRRGAARPAGALRRFASPEAGGAAPPGAPERDVAFAGGIDLCHSRRDDAEHRGDPQAVQMARQYGEHPPWHDVQLRIQGPVVGALDTTFRERWTDPASLDMLSPIAWIADKLRGADLSAGQLPRQPPDPPPCGPQAVQVLRHLSRRPFRVRVRAARRAQRRARLHQGGAAGQTPDLPGGPVPVVQTGRTPVRQRAEGQPGPAPDRRGAAAPRRGRPVRAAAQPGRPPAGDRDLPPGGPASGCTSSTSKTTLAHRFTCTPRSASSTMSGRCVGSDNFNRRSWTHDSELSCAVLDDTRDAREPRDPAGHGDGARVFARDLRLRLLREHLDRAADGSEDDGLVDPVSAVETVAASAQALQDWYDGGRIGPRPPGRLRPHRPENARPAHPRVGRPGVPRRLRPRRPVLPRPAQARVVNTPHIRACADVLPPARTACWLA